MVLVVTHARGTMDSYARTQWDLRFLAAPMSRDKMR